jgi:hypothetical protein
MDRLEALSYKTDHSMTDLETIHSKFLELERDFQLWDKTVSGLPFWDYLRVTVRNEIFNQADLAKSQNNVSGRRSTVFNRLQTRLRLLYSVVFNNPYRQKSWDFLFIGPGPKRRKREVDGRLWDIYCDPIIDHLGPEKCLLVENMPSSFPDFFTRKHTKKLGYEECLWFKSRYIQSSKTNKVILEQEEKEYIKAIEQAILQKFKTKINLESLIINTITSDHSQQIVFDHFLKDHRPKAVFVVCSYGLESVIAVCKNLRIPTIELQHGTIGRLHPGYSFPPPSKKRLFPDYFFSFGEYWEKTTTLPLPSEQIFTVGYPYISNRLSRYKSTNKKRQVIIISQWTLGERFSRFALELYKNLPPDWTIVFKLHPVEKNNWEVRYPDLAKSGMRVVSGDRPPLYSLLAESSIQIGAYSTAIFEGLALGCRTYIIPIPGVEHLQPLIDNGIVSLVSKPKEIDFWGNNIEGSSIPELFSDNWQTRFDLALSEIQKRHGA